MKPMTIDAQAALGFVTAEGRNVETRIYARRYPTYNYAADVPVVTEGAPWAIGTQFRISDWVGKAKFVSGKAKDIPFVKTTRELQSHNFLMIAAGWEWSIEEVEQARLYGASINADDAMAGDMAVQQKLYELAMVGDAEVNWTGLVNNASVQRADAATVSGSTFWGSNKDADDMAADVNAALEMVRANSGEVEMADTVRLPPEAFRTAATRRLGVGDGTLNVLDYIRKNNIYTAETGLPLDIAPLRDLATASNDGGGRLIAYRKDPEVVRFHAPLPRMVLPVNQTGLMSFEQGVISRTGGTEIRLPGAMAYIDEITNVPS